MDIWIHAIASAIIAAVLFPFFGAWSLLVFVGGVLIDADHVIWYYTRKGYFDLKATYHYSKNISKYKNVREYSEAVMIFHTFDVFAAVLIMSIIYNPIVMVLIGLFFHLILDYIEIYREFKKPLFLTMFRKSSIIFFIKLALGKDNYRHYFS